MGYWPPRREKRDPLHPRKGKRTAPLLLVRQNGLQTFVFFHPSRDCLYQALSCRTHSVGRERAGSSEERKGINWYRREREEEVGALLNLNQSSPPPLWEAVGRSVSLQPGRRSLDFLSCSGQSNTASLPPALDAAVAALGQLPCDAIPPASRQREVVHRGIAWLIKVKARPVIINAVQRDRRKR